MNIFKKKKPEPFSFDDIRVEVMKHNHLQITFNRDVAMNKDESILLNLTVAPLELVPGVINLKSDYGVIK